MNRVSPEMLNCLHMTENLAGNCTDMSVLDRQRTRLKWQQQQQQHSQQSQENYFNETQFDVFTAQTAQIQQFQALLNNDFVLRELANRSMKADPGMENVWPDLSKYPVPRTGFNSPEMDFPLSRTSSCSPAVAVENGSESVLTEKMATVVGRGSFKKRKADKSQNPKVVVAEEKRDKRIKDDVEEVESKITEENTNNNNNNREVSADTSKENSKVTEVQKLDYIHVRARRGQATDSHSLAERVRREKISERMKYLQDLVPGCNKITGKAGMLDEIINYVQSLQRQVEFLSMKLATVNPRLDFNIDNLFVKEMFPTMGMSEMANPATYLQFNPEPETFVDSSCFTQAQASSNWESGLQSLYNVDFHQPFTGRELGS